MHKISSSIPPYRYHILLAISVALMAFAHISEIFFGLRPCDLCYQQRYIWYGVVALSLLAVILRGKPIMRLIHMTMMIVLCASALLGAYHTGVEYGWWKGPSSCTGIVTAISAEDFFAQIKQRPVVRCDDVQWRFLFLSMAGYNAIISFILSFIMLILYRNDKRT